MSSPRVVRNANGVTTIHINDIVNEYANEYVKQNTVHPCRNSARPCNKVHNMSSNTHHSKGDNVSNNQDTVNRTQVHPSHISHPDHNEYVSGIRYIRKCCDDCQDAPSEDEKIKVVEKLFEYLITHMCVLVHNAKFRSIIHSKIKEVEKHLEERKSSIDNARYLDAIGIIGASVEKNIRHLSIRQQIHKKLYEIKELVGEYDDFITNNNIMRTIDILKRNLDYIEATRKIV
jgi:hypothetical protein